MERTWLALSLSLALCGCNCSRPPPVEGDPGDEEDGGDGDGGEPVLVDGGTWVDGGFVPCISGISSLAVTPANSSVTLTSGGTIQFAASGTSSSAGSVDVTSTVAWEVTRDDDTPPGTISNGTYVPAAGGVAKVRIFDGCGLTAETSITVRMDSTFQDPGPGVTNLFNGTQVTQDPSKAPDIIYPSDKTRFPRNIYKVLFQWKRNGHNQFRLTFDGPNSRTVVYTDGVHPDCAQAAATAGCFEADRPVWQSIAGSNAGLATTFKVEGVIPNDANVYVGNSIEIGFSKRDVRGAIFYWSTTAKGVRRASVSDSAPEGYAVGLPVPTVLPNGSTIRCVACHTVSRSGKKLFGYTETSTTKGLYVYDVNLQPPPTPLITTQIDTARGFGTFSPDEKRVVATQVGKLVEFDLATQAKLATLPPTEATNPDWSPLGTELIYSNKKGDSPGSAALEVVAYNDGGWGPTRTLAAADGGTNLFPSYSPDGAWVAYSRGKGGHSDSSLRLMIVKADGTSAPIDLNAANRIVNSQLTNGQFENNMPTWAPPGDYDWVAFNSRRPYGVVFPNGGQQQIWVAAIDRSKLGSGSDPSFPAFRFSFQGLNENNHRAFWTLDVRDPEPDAGTIVGPPDAGTNCIPTGDACDQAVGPACCDSSAACDFGVDGGTQCLVPPPIG